MHNIYSLNMIKNKDGSYNKFSLLILGAIAIIALGIIISMIFQSSVSIDSNTLPIIGLIVSGGIAAYYGYKIIWKNKPIKSSMDSIAVRPEETPSQTPSKRVTPSSYVEPIPMRKIDMNKIDKDIDDSIKAYEKRKPTSGSGTGIISAVITLIVAGVGLYICSTVVGSMLSAMPELPEGSALATTQTEVVNNLGAAFNFMGLGILVISVMIIVGLMTKMISGD
jgi:uncharacterized membrane-anchored protein